MSSYLEISNTRLSNHSMVSSNLSMNSLSTYDPEKRENSVSSRSGYFCKKKTKDYSNTVEVTYINNVPYAHGGYAGSAPCFFQDENWMMILQHLMPDEHTVLRNYAKRVDENIEPLKVMKWAENNPVVAAYGILNSKDAKEEREQMKLSQPCSYKSRLEKKRMKRRRSFSSTANPAIEWDVFLDPTIVRNVDTAMKKVEDLMTKKVSSENVIAANIEVDRQVSRLMNRMMLAHGSAAQLLVEAVGVATSYNFSRVVQSGQHLRHKLKEATKNVMDVGTRTIFVDKWLYLFSEALKLGEESKKSIVNLMERKKTRSSRLKRNRSFQQKTSQFLRNSLSPKSSFDSDSTGLCSYSHEDPALEFHTAPLCGLFLCLGMSDPGSLNVAHGNSIMAESAGIIRKLLGQNLSLVLDMKSRHVPARVWGRLIDNLRSRGLDVHGIGSFDIDELRQIGTRTSSPVTAISFFHSAGDLQRACHANEIKRGDTVYFNAGSLMWKRWTICEATNCFANNTYENLRQVSSDFDGNFEPLSFQQYAYPNDVFEHHDVVPECKATIADYQKHFDLKIGLYVQEFSIGSDELDVLVRLVNKYPSVYSCGLAWGGLNGIALKGVKGDGFWSQRYVGRNWTFSAAPARNMTLIAPEDHHIVQKAINAGSCNPIVTVNMEDDDTKCLNANIISFTQTGNLDELAL